MKITHISDTHNKHDKYGQLSPGDVLVHSGDVSENGRKDEISVFFKWFFNQPFKHKILVPGNHDFYFEKVPRDMWDFQIPESVHILINDSVVIDGVKFHGVSYQPAFFNWAFNLKEEELVKEWSKIEEDTNVLITHSPASDILDKNANMFPVGSLSLRDRIENLKKLSLHLFGHVHEDVGDKYIDTVLHINASMLGRGGRINPPRRVELSEDGFAYFND